MANNYEKFSWSCSGFKTQQEAIEARDDIEKWFLKTHPTDRWQVLTTVRQGPYGWKAELDGTFVKDTFG